MPHEDKQAKRDAKMAAARAERKKIIASYSKKQLTGRDKSGNVESTIARKASKMQSKREDEEARKDIDVMLQARKARKDGLSEKDQSRIYKHLSGARKRKTVRKIASSIE